MRPAFSRFALALILFAVFPVAAAIKLYMTDGTYQDVREYQIQQDRVRFYSTERSEWEEVPLSLVDLKRTDQEQKRLVDERRDSARMQDAEDAAEVASRREAQRIPMTPGAYWVHGGKLIAIPQGESKVVTNKRRSVLKALSPVPMVAGKANVEMEGEHAPTKVDVADPEFYLRLDQPERFGIIRLTIHKGKRIAEKLTIVPVADQPIESSDLIDVIRQQAGENLYKISPMSPLEPGEYAVVEYTENEVNMQIWDFSCTATQPAHSASNSQ